jgi:hypothetical protein
MLLFYAFLLYLLIRIVKNKLKYKKVFQIFICCYTVTVMGDLINTIIIYIRGLDNIKNIYDTSLTGLNLLTSIELIGIVPYISLGYVNPFQIGFLILLSVGLKTVIDIKQVEAMIISVLFWLIIVLIPTLSVYFSLIT